MAATALERQLVNDVQSLGDMVADESFYTDLYRSLTRTSWSREGGHVSLSYKRAEELVNQVRAKHDRPALELAQTGGEGEVSERVADALRPLGWTPKPLNTGRQDPAHVETQSDTQRQESEPPEWERQAHEEAERNRN